MLVILLALESSSQSKKFLLAQNDHQNKLEIGARLLRFALNVFRDLAQKRKREKSECKKFGTPWKMVVL